MDTKKKAIFYLVRLAVQKLLGFVLYLIGAGFAPRAAGTVYFSVLFAATMASGGVILRANAKTLAERGKTATDSPVWDKLLLGVFWLLNYFVIYFLAGRGGATDLDGRFWAGMALVLLAGWVTLRATLENTYLESTARLQTDRGQTVCTSGPYAVVRHPAYAGVLINCVGLCLVFPARGVFICAAVIAAVIAARTALEDKLLRGGLDGYAAYAERVRYRLIPFIW